MKKRTGFLLGAALLGLTSIGNSLDSNAMLVYAEDISIMEKENIPIAENVAVGNTDVDCLEIRAKSAYLMDFDTQTVMYSMNESTRLPIASMCKIMTLILSFEAIDQGVFSMTDEIAISENAASMGGSQVFLEANAKYVVKELIKSMRLV